MADVNILLFVGSYRKHGNTDQVVGLIREHLGHNADRYHEPLEIETLYLGDQEIGPCRGCRVCFDRGEDKCPWKDDMLPIKAKMQRADGILVASPVYVDDVSGIVKNWIDRLAYVCHRPEFAGKCAYLVTTVAASPTSHTLRTLNLAMGTWGFYIVGQAGFRTGALMKPDEMRARYQTKTAKVAQEFFKAIHEHKYLDPSFVSLMTFKIQQRSWLLASQDTLDYQYWNHKGWIDPRREFYIPHRASRVKVALARLAGSVIARFVT